MKKLLMVVSTLDHGGAQKVFANLTLSFPEDWQIDILLNSAEHIAFPYRGNVISLNVNTDGDRTGYWYLFKVFARRYRMLRKLKRENGYDACISALESANVVNVLTGNKYCQTILTVHSFTSKYMKQLGSIKQWILYMTVRMFYNLADKIVVVSESAKNDLIRKFHVKERKAVTIYNGFPINGIMERSRQELTEEEKGVLSGDCFKLAAVGRLSEEKAQWHLIRALQKVKTVIPNIRLIILGEGNLREYLVKLIRECGLEENVVLFGFTENPYKIMAQCDGFVMVSLFEGLPGVLVESLACGLPCISSDFDSGAREILAPDTEIDSKVLSGWHKEKHGILCPVCDGKKRTAKEALTKEEECLADAIIALGKDEAMRAELRESSVERAWQLDADRIMEKWLEII